VFGGKLIGEATSLASLKAGQKAAVATLGAAFAGLLSLFNIGGRIFWASLSDHIGRKRTYAIVVALGTALYVLTAAAGSAKAVILFVGSFCVILTMYGGGFATIPAYLADLFGTQYVGAIHGRLLTAWSTAGILGPVMVNYLREFQISRGVPPEAAYNLTLYLLAGLLVMGLVCNWLVRPVHPRFFMSEAELEEERKALRGLHPDATVESTRPSARSWIAVSVGWLLVGLPLGWGLLITFQKAATFFR
jgi:MFS family permease